MIYYIFLASALIHACGSFAIINTSSLAVIRLIKFEKLLEVLKKFEKIGGGLICNNKYFFSSGNIINKI